MKCPSCDGCGCLADTDAREPWSEWLALPEESRLAILVGLVRPVRCERCGGSGEVQSGEQRATE